MVTNERGCGVPTMKAKRKTLSPMMDSDEQFSKLVTIR
jgi:hypothetical protein